MRPDAKVSCEQVWRELSNFIDGDIDRPAWEAIERHLRHCPHCTALRDGTRNLLNLFRDERLVEVPAGFSERLHTFLTQRMRQ